MPSDASIYGLIRPAAAPVDPMQQYGQALALRGLIGQQELQQLQLQDTRESLGEKQSVRDLFRKYPTGNVPESEVFSASPTYGLTYQKSRLENLKTRGEIDKNDAALVVTKTAQHRDQLSGVNDPQTAQQWVVSGYQDPVLAPILMRSKPLEQALAAIPQDAEGFARWKQENALGATKFIEANAPKFTSQDLGGTSRIVATPGLGGAAAVVPGSVAQKTMTPGELASNSIAGARLGIERARAGFEGVPLPAGGGAGGAGGVAPAAPAAQAAPVQPRPAAPAIAPRAAAVAPAAAAPSQTAIPLPPGINPNTKAAQEYTIKLAAEKPRDLTALEEGISSIDQAIEQAKKVRGHPGFNGLMQLGSGATGAARIPFTDIKPFALPGTDAYDAQQALGTLKGQVMLGVLQKLKSISPTGASGFGQLSNAEGDVLRNSITNLESAQSPAALQDAFDTVINSMENAKKRMKSGYQRIYGEAPNIKSYTNIPPPTAAGKIGGAAGVLTPNADGSFSYGRPGR